MNFKNLKQVFIIAEIGQNHQGDIELAKQMIQKAKEAGVNCVKFQKSSLKDKFTKAALDKPYDSTNSWGDTYGEHKEHLEFSIEQFRVLKNYAESLGLVFSASAMDSVSFDQLKSLDLEFIKIGSGDTNNIPLIRYIAKQDTPLIVSTGMQTEATIKRVREILKAGSVSYALLHCISSYPFNLEDARLGYITRFQELFPETVIGYRWFFKNKLLFVF